MRWQWLSAVALAVTGCGARSSLGSPTGDVGAPALEVAQMVEAPYVDGPALALHVGWPDCGCTGHSSPAFAFFIDGTDFPQLQPGAVFALAGSVTSPTTGVRVMGTTPEWLTGGTIELTSYEPGVSATGSYDVLFAGGAASGVFSAHPCPPTSGCGF